MGFTWPGMHELEGQVDLEFSPHPAEDDLDLDRVGHDDAEQVVGVAALRDRGARQVGLVPDLLK